MTAFAREKRFIYEENKNSDLHRSLCGNDPDILRMLDNGFV